MRHVPTPALEGGCARPQGLQIWTYSGTRSQASRGKKKNPGTLAGQLPCREPRVAGPSHTANGACVVITKAHAPGGRHILLATSQATLRQRGPLKLLVSWRAVGLISPDEVPQTYSRCLWRAPVICAYQREPMLRLGGRRRSLMSPITGEKNAGEGRPSQPPGETTVQGRRTAGDVGRGTGDVVIVVHTGG